VSALVSFGGNTSLVMPFISQDWRGPGEDWVRGQDGWKTNRVQVAEERKYSTLDRIIKPANYHQIINNQNITCCSKDWRGPGEDWVRGQDGWETSKVAPRRRQKSEADADKENFAMVISHPARLERHRSLPELQPCCPIIVKSTKEVPGFNSLSDALKRLDFRSAVHDIRRFQYVSHLLRLLLTPEKLSHLPGGSQKLIYRILEEMAAAVYIKNQNEHVLRKLLGDLHTTLDQYRVWGAHLGSEQMQKGHNASRSRIACIAAVEKRRSIVRLEEEQRDAEEKNFAQMGDLPEECVREILLRLSDGGDVDRAAL